MLVRLAWRLRALGPWLGLLALGAGCIDPSSGGGFSLGPDRCAGLVCLAADSCHLPGECDRETGLCSNPPKICGGGQVCDLGDGQCHYTCLGVVCPVVNACVVSRCEVQTGQCSAPSPRVCPAQETCDPADGVCKGAGCAGVVCTASDLCHLPGTCDPQTSQCSLQTPKTCPTGQVCELPDGQCVDLCAGVVCQPSDRCHVAGTCNPATGQCSAETTKTCPSGQTCDPTDGQCKDLCATVTCPIGEVCDPGSGQCVESFTVPVPQRARDLGINPPGGVAIDVSANTYIAAYITSASPVNFDGHLVASTGAEDILLARYNPGGSADWAVGFGDSQGNTQIATGVAVTANGTVASIGNFSGSVTIGPSTISSANQIDFLAGLDAATGNGLWAKSFNDGTNGLLVSVGASPSSATNRVAVCGKASQAATDLVPGATFGGQTDLILGVFGSGGARLWSAQIGGSGNEECDAVTVDDAGNVYAAGKFDGASLTFPPLAPLTGPGTTTRKFLWVAKLDGTSGAAIGAVAFSGTVGQVTPTALSVDGAGNLLVAGNFTGTNLTFGTGAPLSSAGGQDMFVVKLDPSLAPVWSQRMGGSAVDTASGVGSTSQGDILVTGTFRNTTTGVAVLTANGVAPDVFLLKLKGDAGTAEFAASYGDPSLQTGDGLAVNRAGTGTAQDHFAIIGTLNGTITFPAPAGPVTAPGTTDVFLLFGQLQ